MPALCSRVSTSGHAVLVRIPDGASFTATFADDGTCRDITSHVANLLLAGALDVLEQEQTGRPDPEEQVEAALLGYLEPPRMLGVPVEPVSFTWMHLPSGEAGDFPPADVLPLVARGLVVELTAAVAADADDVPDTPAGLDEDAAEIDG